MPNDSTAEQAAPKRRGRPALPEGDGKTERIEWRTHPERKAAAQALADAAGLTVSRFMDGLIDAASKKRLHVRKP